MKQRTIGPTIAFAATFFISFSLAQTKKDDNPKRAIICLTYDDGLETQLTTALPQLDSMGFKATFFLPSIQGSSQSDIIGKTPEAVIGWTNAAKHGHELANHTLFHPCPEIIGWDKSAAIENYTIDRLITEVSTQNTLLSLLDPTRNKRAFALPCNNAFIGNVDYPKVLKEKELITFARAGGDSNSIINNFKQLDKIKVPSWHVWTGTSLQQLITFAEKVKKSEGMGVYQFHGVGGNIFSITPQTHKDFLKYLKEHQDEYWIVTFSEAMEYVSKH
jgi:peptidoglycan/xylan/chitin deacetylase (PgdA/CDA1 family)